MIICCSNLFCLTLDPPLKLSQKAGSRSYGLFSFPSGTGRSAVHFSSDAAKRRSSRLIREKVQEQGAFISRVTERVTAAESVGSGRRARTIGDNVMMMELNLKAEHEKVQRDQRNMQQHSGIYMDRKSS